VSPRRESPFRTEAAWIIGGTLIAVTVVWVTLLVLPLLEVAA
jgi:hypothetical protein